MTERRFMLYRIVVWRRPSWSWLDGGIWLACGPCRAMLRWRDPQ